MHYKLLVIVPTKVYNNSENIHDIIDYARNLASKYSSYNNDINITLSLMMLYQTYQKFSNNKKYNFEDFCKDIGIDKKDIKSKDINIFPIYDYCRIHTDSTVYDIIGKKPYYKEDIHDTDNTQISDVKSTNDTSFWNIVIKYITFGLYNISDSKSDDIGRYYITSNEDKFVIGKNIAYVEEFLEEEIYINYYPPIIDKEGILHIKGDSEYNMEFICNKDTFYNVLENNKDDMIIVIDCHN